MQWQIYYRSASRLPKDAALEKALKGDAKERYLFKKELAQYDSIKPADPPVAEVMVDQGRDAPATYILAKGVWDAHWMKSSPVSSRFSIPILRRSYRPKA